MTPYAAPKRSHVLYSGPERDQLEAWLGFLRGTLLVKCDGLSDEQLKARPIESSALSLLGLVRHYADVERTWLEITFSGLDTPEFYRTPEDRDVDFRDLEDTPVEQVFANFDLAVARSRELAAGHELDEMAARDRRGLEVDLRWIYLHLIEEYARHAGHADLLRELLDGTTGL